MSDAITNQQLQEFGQRIAALEALHKTAAGRAAEDRADMKQRFEVANQEMKTELGEVRSEMREQLDDVRSCVNANSAAVTSLAGTIQSYTDQASGAMKMGAAFKALAVVAWTAVFGVIVFAISHAGSIVKILQAPPPR